MGHTGAGALAGPASASFEMVAARAAPAQKPIMGSFAAQAFV